jgi:hypothetical protein
MVLTSDTYLQTVRTQVDKIIYDKELEHTPKFRIFVILSMLEEEVANDLLRGCLQLLFLEEVKIISDKFKE